MEHGRSMAGTLISISSYIYIATYLSYVCMAVELPPPPMASSAGHWHDHALVYGMYWLV